jgi:hypothetical protein
VSQKTETHKALELLRERRGTPEHEAILAAMQGMLEDVKDRLVTASPADVGALQGEARAYQRVLREIKLPTYADINRRMA